MEQFFPASAISLAALALAIGGGAVFTPLLLPFLPFRAFSLKGLTVGLISCLLLLAWQWEAISTPKAFLGITGWFLIIVALTSFLAMNFTGASTYTSLSGVKKEMRFAVPLQIATAGCGAFLWFLARVIG